MLSVFEPSHQYLVSKSQFLTDLGPFRLGEIPVHKAKSNARSDLSLMQALSYVAGSDPCLRGVNS